VTQVEKRAFKAHVASMPTADFLDRFFKLNRALQVLAYDQRFAQRCRKQSLLLTVRLEAQVVSTAERLNIRTQHRSAAA